MPETSRIDPFADVISLVAGPIAAVVRSFDQLRRGADELMRGFENFNNTMANLNETVQRVNRLLADFEEPVRAMLPQMTRTVKLADEISTRLATPIDQVIPGLRRLADTLDSPVLRAMPTDLGQFMNVINDLGRRLSPLTQMAEQASSMFGLRIPGLRSPSSSPSPGSAAPAEVAAKAAATATRPAPTKSATTATARKTTARKVTAGKATTKKAAAAAKKRPAKAPGTSRS